MKSNKNGFTLISEGYSDLKQDKLNRLQVLESKAAYFDMLKTLLPNYIPNTTKLIEWHNAQQNARGIKGGVGSGKTHAMCADDILVSYLNSPYIHLNTSPSFDNAKETVLVEYMKLCDMNNLQYDWIESKNNLVIEHGDNKISNIKIFGADSPKFFKGVNAASGSMNEPFSQKKEAFTVWWERIRVKAAKRISRVWGGTAEPEKMQWGFEYFDKALINTKNLFAITITTWDNKQNLAPDYIPQLLQKYDARMQKVYMHGLYENLAVGTAYSFSREKNIMPIAVGLKRLAAMPHKTIVLSFDFNINPMTCTEVFLDGTEDIQIDEYKVSSSNTREIARLVADRINRRYDLHNNPHGASFIITGDGSGLKGDTRSQDRYYNDYSIIKEELERIPNILMKFVLPDNGQNPHVHDSVQLMNARFEKQLTWICDNCENTITDFCVVTWKQGAEKFYLNKANADQTHLSDSRRYGVWHVQPLLIDALKRKPSIVTTYSNRWR